MPTKRASQGILIPRIDIEFFQVDLAIEGKLWSERPLRFYPSSIRRLFLGYYASRNASGAHLRLALKSCDEWAIIRNDSGK
jgi:hypothetical protein